MRPDSPAPAPAPGRPGFYEFFAGGGMARAGLGAGWRCLFANDIDAAKAAAYRANFGEEALRVADIHALAARDLPGTADLMWGSFPCQDLSVAGLGAGLGGERSGAFHGFWRLVDGLVAEGRGPRVTVLENVCGTLTANAGRDFHAICSAFAAAGYRVGALVVDAELFVPQSRPRLFVVGVRAGAEIAPDLMAPAPLDDFHPAALRRAVEGLPAAAALAWAWWRLPPPPLRRQAFADLIEASPEEGVWRTASQTAQLLALMSPLHLAKVEAARRSGRRCVGAVYRRTRVDAGGGKAQRAEVRFDEVAGCLRTPAGGSSRQLLLVVEGDGVRSRLVSPRETARLMGLPDSYRLPPRANAAYHLTGDGVVAPVVAHLARNLIEPLLGLATAEQMAA
ncbi:DNA cytosine methyltransferase [Caulobacter sp. S45]|uniref:DNA cytosine methyltransferase n=1 Tax=Caulobacter sp. S45 TaxID=1641861 RepID=UPI0015751E51|nr:DNA (cytosine-5-)-methyltransferase [Caulobacter sp. S45]